MNWALVAEWIGWVFLLLLTVYVAASSFAMLVFSRGFTGRIHPLVVVFSAATLALGALTWLTAPFVIVAS